MNSGHGNARRLWVWKCIAIAGTGNYELGSMGSRFDMLANFGDLPSIELFRYLVTEETSDTALGRRLPGRSR